MVHFIPWFPVGDDTHYFVVGVFNLVVGDQVFYLYVFLLQAIGDGGGVLECLTAA